LARVQTIQAAFFRRRYNSLSRSHGDKRNSLSGQCGVPINLSKSESGIRSRANLTWHITPDIMTYYTFSQGFRPGGFNRTYSLPGQAPGAIGIAPYCGPASTDPRCLPGGSLVHLNTAQNVKSPGYNSDNLINNELGFKSEFLNHRLRVNGSAYLMRWNGVQSMALGLAGFVGGLDPLVNGPTYTVKGLELQLIARVNEGLTLQGTGSWNNAKQASIPCLKSSGVTPLTPYNPTPAGQCITVVAGQRLALSACSTAQHRSHRLSPSTCGHITTGTPAITIRTPGSVSVISPARATSQRFFPTATLRYRRVHTTQVHDTRLHDL
jgi:outer membrane receptor protein involved in Fe transport